MNFCRLKGVINLLSKFSPNNTSLSQLLQELLSPLVAWLWTKAYRKAFWVENKEIASSRILALYDASNRTKISADAQCFMTLSDVQWHMHHMLSPK